VPINCTSNMAWISNYFSDQPAVVAKGRPWASALGVAIAGAKLAGRAHHTAHAAPAAAGRA